MVHCHLRWKRFKTAVKFAEAMGLWEVQLKGLRAGLPFRPTGTFGAGVAVLECNRTGRSSRACF